MENIPGYEPGDGSSILSGRTKQKVHMALDPWSLDCPQCGPNYKLVPDSIACAEIRGDCYQWCWYECEVCGFETLSEEAVNGDRTVWERLYNKYLVE